MRSSLSLSCALLLSALPNAFAQSSNPTDPTKRAELALSALHIWYNAGTGLWDTTGWWNSANVLTLMGNLAKHDSNNAQVQDLARKVFATTIVKAPAKNPQPGIEGNAGELRRRGNDTDFTIFNVTERQTGYSKSIGSNGEYITTYPEGWAKNEGAYVDVKDLPINQPEGTVNTAAAPKPHDWLDGFYDDDLWWALGWVSAYDVTKNIEYLQLAEGIFMAVTKSWPTRCGNGGIFWSWQEDYMNAIANELFFSTAAHLANRAENKSFYVDWAERSLKWFVDSGMINEKGTINDGLTEGCKNNGDVVWSYNQGVILGGLVELNKAAPKSSHLQLAARIAKAAIQALSDKNGVIHDVCEPNCGADGTQFKGVFMRNLQLLHAAAPDDAYVKCAQANANSNWDNNRDQGNRMSVNWAQYVGVVNASTQSSAMEALVAAITVR